MHACIDNNYILYLKQRVEESRNPNSWNPLLLLLADFCCVELKVLIVGGRGIKIIYRLVIGRIVQGKGVALLRIITNQRLTRRLRDSVLCHIYAE